MKKTLKKAVSLLLSASLMASSMAFNISADDEMSAEISQSELAEIFEQNMSVGSSDIITLDPSNFKVSYYDEPFDVTKVTADPKSYYGGTNSYNFYNILNANEKLVYNAVGATLKNDITADKVSVAGSFSNFNEVWQGLSAFIMDHPEYFHLWEAEGKYYNGGITLELYPCDGQTNSGMATNYTKVMDIVKAKVDSLSSLNTYDKALALARYLCDNIVYNTGAGNVKSSAECYKYPNCWNAYGALINGDCVCEGYAEAYKMLCDYANIPCILVISPTHEFNMVYMDGKWYNVDVTWMDAPKTNGHYCDGVDTRYSINWFLVGSTTTGKQDTNIHHTPSNGGKFGGTTLAYPTLSTSDYVYEGGSALVGPDAPVISDTVMGSSGMYIYWNAVPNAKGYRIYRSDYFGGTKEQIGDTSSTGFCDITAVSGKTYYYYIAAYNSNNILGEYSSARKTVATVLTAPGLNDSAIGDAGLYLYWNSIPGATSYSVYRADSSSGTKKLLTTTANTNYIDSTAVSGKTYYYYVTAFSSNTNVRSAFSTARKITMTKISTPSLTDTCIGDAGLYLYWSSVPGATSYRIYRADSQTGTKEQILVTANLNGIDTTAVAGKTYYYFVAAFNNQTMIRSAYSTSRKVTMTKISTPSLTDTCIGDAGLYLYWSSVPGATSYRIYRADSQTGTKQQILVTANLNGIDTTAVSGKTYYYYVAAFNNQTMIRSAYSTARKVIMTKISAPSIKSATSTTSGVQLTWGTVSGATSYRVYRADSSTGAKTLLKVQAGNTFTDTTAVSGKTYYYYVAAFNNQTNIRSAMSSSKSVTA